MFYPITTDLVSTIPSEKHSDIHLLDIENSSAHITETMIKNRKSLFVICASKTQTYAIQNIMALANLLNVDVAVDSFTGIDADKADKRFLIVFDNLISHCKKIETTCLYTKDKAFKKEFLDQSSQYKGIFTTSNGDCAFNLDRLQHILVSKLNSKLAKRYLKTLKQHNRSFLKR